MVDRSGRSGGYGLPHLLAAIAGLSGSGRDQSSGSRHLLIPLILAAISNTTEPNSLVAMAGVPLVPYVLGRLGGFPAPYSDRRLVAYFRCC